MYKAEGVLYATQIPAQTDIYDAYISINIDPENK